MNMGAAGTAHDADLLFDLGQQAKRLRGSANLLASVADQDPILAEIAIQQLSSQFPGLNARRVFDAALAELEKGDCSSPIQIFPDLLKPVEFVVDGFCQAGINVISGATGAGKTNCLVPMCCIVAWLYGETELNPEFRRHVIYLAEDPDQVERLLYAIRKAGGLSADEFNEWFHLFPAKRVSPGTLAGWLRRWEKAFSYIHRTHKIGPLVVCDTTNANIDIRDESDNAAVGQALSIIRQSLGACSLWLVTHLPKALNRSGDPVELSARGAGAWEADANQTMALVADERMPDKRFLVLKKTRFFPEYQELEFLSELDIGSAQTPWGSIQRIPYRTVRMTALKDESGLRRQREQLNQKAREDAAESLRQKVLSYLNREADSKVWKGLTEKHLTDSLGGKRANVIAALHQLIEQGDVVMERSGAGATAAKRHWPKNRPPR